MKEELQRELEEITNRLVKTFNPEKIILFGSYAWGKPDEDSDLDLLVIIPKSDLPVTKRATMAYHCLHGLTIPKDIFVYTHEEVEKKQKVYASLVSQIFEEGKVLYG